MKKTFVLTLPEPGLNAPALSRSQIDIPRPFLRACACRHFNALYWLMILSTLAGYGVVQVFNNTAQVLTWAHLNLDRTINLNPNLNLHPHPSLTL